MSSHRIEWLLDGEDLEGVLEVDRASFAHPWTREMYEEDVRHGDRAYIAVLRTPEWRVGGYISFWVVVDELHINNVAVRPEARANGFGRQLVEFALRHGATRGVVAALLDVRRSNLGARRLYERLGFTQVAVRSSYYADPEEDALVLRRPVRNLESNPIA